MPLLSKIHIFFSTLSRKCWKTESLALWFMLVNCQEINVEEGAMLVSVTASNWSTSTPRTNMLRQDSEQILWVSLLPWRAVTAGSTATVTTRARSASSTGSGRRSQQRSTQDREVACNETKARKRKRKKEPNPDLFMKWEMILEQLLQILSLAYISIRFLFKEFVLWGRCLSGC